MKTNKMKWLNSLRYQTSWSACGWIFSIIVGDQFQLLSKIINVYATLGSRKDSENVIGSDRISLERLQRFTQIV